VSLYHVDFSRSLLNLVPRETAEKYCLIPIFVRRVRKQGETLYVAMDDPTNEAAIQDVSRAAALQVKPMIACPSDIRSAIRVYYMGEAAPGPASASAPESVPIPVPAPLPPPPATPRVRPRVAAPLPAPAPTPTPVAAPVPELVAPRKARAKMFSLTLLDGTTISLPSPRNRRPSTTGTAGEAPPSQKALPGEEISDQLTARDLVSALRAVAHGVDASEILGTEPRWEAMFSALLSILLRKGLIADWEFVEEFRKV
jgi:type IV pilus assembly protein PilB